MGIIVNIRGPSGSGKTELVRRILSAYGLELTGDGVHGAEPVCVPGRSRPFGYRVAHPSGASPPLFVVGAYGRTVGGCDTIPVSDGGLVEALARAVEHLLAGGSVLLEGAALSQDVCSTLAIARRYPVHILRLSTPAEVCAMNLLRRQRRSSAAFPGVLQKILRQTTTIEVSCASLRTYATVEHLSFDAAFERGLALLGNPDRSTAGEPQ